MKRGFRSLLCGLLGVALFLGVLLGGSKEAKANLDDIEFAIEYNISYEADNKATFSGVDGENLIANATKDTKVWFMVTPKDGYMIENVRSMVSDVDLKMEDDKVYSFIMPDCDVIICAQTKPVEKSGNTDPGSSVKNDTTPTSEPKKGESNQSLIIPSQNLPNQEVPSQNLPNQEFQGFKAPNPDPAWQNLEKNKAGALSNNEVNNKFGNEFNFYDMEEEHLNVGNNNESGYKFIFNNSEVNSALVSEYNSILNRTNSTIKLNSELSDKIKDVAKNDGNGVIALTEYNGEDCISRDTLELLEANPNVILVLDYTFWDVDTNSDIHVHAVINSEIIPLVLDEDEQYFGPAIMSSFVQYYDMLPDAIKNMNL